MTAALGRRVLRSYPLGRRRAFGNLLTVWEARSPLACTGCGAAILPGERYTWSPVAHPRCYGCRPWQLRPQRRIDRCHKS